MMTPPRFPFSLVFVGIGLLALLGVGLFWVNQHPPGELQPRLLASVWAIRPSLSATFPPAPTSLPSLTPLAPTPDVPSLAPTLTLTSSATPAPSLPNTSTPAARYVMVIAQGRTNVLEQPDLTARVLGAVLADDILRWHSQQTDALNFIWYEVQTAAGEVGWLAALNVRPMAASAVRPSAVLARLRPWVVILPTASLTPAQLLYATPLLANLPGAAPQIYARGQQLGRNPAAFSKIGDSNSISETFLRPFDQNAYALGAYQALEPTLQWYQGSFARQSLAVEIGFNIATIQDPLLADPQNCQANEAPFVCEYRAWQPSIVIMMFGANDLIHLTPQRYQQHLQTLVEATLQQGIIPVLTTFPRRPDESWEQVLAFNAVMVELANAYQLPLINLWLAAQALPNSGLNADNIHLNQGGESILFNGEEGRWGQTLRNLLTLQMLDALRQLLGLTPAP